MANDDLNEFLSVSGDDRIRKIMSWEKAGDKSKFAIIAHAILNDSDPGVKMAALKRIHLLGNEQEVRHFLSDEKTRRLGSVEPYYSMALSRTRLISKEEFEARLKGPGSK